MRGLFLFDLDGTLYEGEAPFRYFTQTIARGMDEPNKSRCLDPCAAYFAANSREIVATWDAVIAMTDPFVEDPKTCPQAYWDTCDYMLDDACSLVVNPALRQFLHEAHGHATLVLATNSPPEAALPLLRRLQLLDAFDHIHTEVGKPEGLVPLGSRLAPDLPSYHIVSIGDSYPNDMVPAWQAGWQTAHISPK